MRQEVQREHEDRGLHAGDRPGRRRAPAPRYVRLSAIVARETGERLLALARDAVLTWALGKPTPRPVTVLQGGERRAGAFVTLYHHGTLRGCIGHIEADRPLSEVVIEMAVAAARDDPRFPPVTAEEAGELDFEISVLTPCAPARPEDVVPGRDGVLVRRGERQGVLLPQVAPENGWTRDTLLAMACRKAGLPADAWLDARTALFTFQAQVIAAAPA